MDGHRRLQHQGGGAASLYDGDGMLNRNETDRQTDQQSVCQADKTRQDTRLLDEIRLHFSLL